MPCATEASRATTSLCGAGVILPLPSCHLEQAQPCRPSIAAPERCPLPPYTLANISDGAIAAPGIPPSLQNQVSIDEWVAFWERLRPMAQKVADTHKKFTRIGWGLAPFVLLLVVAYVLTPVESFTGDLFILYSMTFWIVLKVIINSYFSWVFRLRQSQLDELRAMGRYEADRLSSSGKLAVKCDYGVPSAVSLGADGTTRKRLPVGYYLYFSPVHSPLLSGVEASSTSSVSEIHDCDVHDSLPSVVCQTAGYLRIQIEAPPTTMSKCCGVIPFNLLWPMGVVASSVLSSRTFVPTCFFNHTGQWEYKRNAAEAAEVWSKRFWPTMMQRSLIMVPFYRWHGLLIRVYEFYLLFLISALKASWGDGETIRWLNVVNGFVTLGFVFVMSRLAAGANRQKDLVDEYAPEFAALGWYIEYRQVFCYTAYLYLFPMPKTMVANDGEINDLYWDRVQRSGINQSLMTYLRVALVMGSRDQKSTPAAR